MRTHADSVRISVPGTGETPSHVSFDRVDGVFVTHCGTHFYKYEQALRRHVMDCSICQQFRGRTVRGAPENAVADNVSDNVADDTVAEQGSNEGTQTVALNNEDESEELDEVDEVDEAEDAEDVEDVEDTGDTASDSSPEAVTQLGYGCLDCEYCCIKATTMRSHRSRFRHQSGYVRCMVETANGLAPKRVEPVAQEPLTATVPDQVMVAFRSMGTSFAAQLG